MEQDRKRAAVCGEDGSGSLKVDLWITSDM